jgi:hydrogenase maturation protease
MSAGAWERLAQRGAETVVVDGVTVGPGSRVRLRPRPGADVMDVVLAERTAIVEAVEQDVEGAITLAVVIEDDPGRDLGFARSVGHRFFFAPAEVEPLPRDLAPCGAARILVAGIGNVFLGDDGCDVAPVPGRAPAAGAPRVLVAGIGNLFLGDDGFGVALAERLGSEPLPAGVTVEDFGIRGLDLAFAIQDGWDAVVMLDATPRGQAPGTLYVIEADPNEGEATLDGHGMNPLAVIGLVRAFGATVPRTLVVGCEPATRLEPDDDELVGELSGPVQAALAPAVALVRSLLHELLPHADAQEVSHP